MSKRFQPSAVQLQLLRALAADHRIHLFRDKHGRHAWLIGGPEAFVCLPMQTFTAVKCASWIERTAAADGFEVWHVSAGGRAVVADAEREAA
jgi:hypothetical protein